MRKCELFLSVRGMVIISARMSISFDVRAYAQKYTKNERLYPKIVVDIEFFDANECGNAIWILIICRQYFEIVFRTFRKDGIVSPLVDYGHTLVLFSKAVYL